MAEYLDILGDIFTVVLGAYGVWQMVLAAERRREERLRRRRDRR